MCACACACVCVCVCVCGVCVYVCVDRVVAINNSNCIFETVVVSSEIESNDLSSSMSLVEIKLSISLPLWFLMGINTVIYLSFVV